MAHNKGRVRRDFAAMTTMLSLRSQSEGEVQELLFDAIRAGNVTAIGAILKFNDKLLTARMPGHLQMDMVTDHKSYSFKVTDKDKDKDKEYFYPLHVAAGAGQKDVCAHLLALLLPSRLHEELDYLGETAEWRAQGEALHVFYEMVYGYSYPCGERYEGDKRKDRRDGHDKRQGKGELYYKLEGYIESPPRKEGGKIVHEKRREVLLYRGRFKDDLYNGMGTLFWPETGHKRYVGLFKAGHQNGRGIEFDVNGIKVYKGSFRKGLRHGRGSEYAARVGGVGMSIGSRSINNKSSSSNTGGSSSNIVGSSSSSSSNSSSGSGSSSSSSGNTTSGNTTSGNTTVATQVVCTYRGEWANNLKHGYGILYDHMEGLCHVFVGTFLDNEKTGIGIFYNAVDKSLFEGMFYQGQPNGHGSFYTRDAETGAMTGVHYLMERAEDHNKPSRKMEEISEPFVPPKNFVPDHHESLLRRQALSDYDYIFSHSHREDRIEAEAQSLASSHFAAKAQRRASIAFSSAEKTAFVGNWKSVLGKYLRLSKKDAELLEMDFEPDPVTLRRRSSSSSSSSRRSRRSSSRVRFDDEDDYDDEGERGDDDADDEGGDGGDGDHDGSAGGGRFHASTDGEIDSDGNDDMDEDEELGYRWRECEALSIAYLYVKTIQRVFEGREIDIHSDDSDSVHDLVFDAIESFETKVREALQPPGARNKKFDSDKQRESTLQKLQADLDARKVSADLSPDVEARIATEVLTSLKKNLDLLNDASSKMGKRPAKGMLDPSATSADRAYRHALSVDNNIIGMDEGKAVGNEFARELHFILSRLCAGMV